MSITPNQSSNPEKTLDLLWARVRQRGDLPGFSKVVTAILGAMQGENDREFNMTKTVLADPTLTQKVLRLANSAMYAVFGREVNTVSKAVIILGTESIGHLALGLKLVDGLSAATADSANARAEMEKAVLSGHIARHVASTASTRDAEEAVVCSMLHGLGRMMVSFYLSDRWLLVQARSRETGISENEAARDILGLGLDEIGRLIAQQWNLPSGLVNSLPDIEPDVQSEPLTHAGWLAAISTMSSRVAEVLHKEENSGMAAIEKIAGSYAEMLGLEVAQVLGAIETAQQTVLEDAAFSRMPKAEKTVRRSEPAKNAGKPADAAMLLSRGVADMRGVSNTASAGQLMTMALETVYKGLGLSRAIVFLRSRSGEKYVANMCFGEGVQEIMARLSFDDAYQPDVFHAALANDKMIFVEHAQSAAFINKLPRWWKDAFPTARSFIVLPLTVNRQAAGFIYGDWDMNLPPTKIEPAEILPVNELRSLVVQAVELRRRIDSNSSGSIL
ncbi:HDOD domain-containing protein [soil metagenome]